MTVRADVKQVVAHDFESWTAFENCESSDPYDDYGWFTVSVGETDGQGADDFELCVATHRAVGRAKSEGSIPGILVVRFDAASIYDAILERVNSIESHHWIQVVNELRKFMRWEYEGMFGRNT